MESDSLLSSSDPCEHGHTDIAALLSLPPHFRSQEPREWEKLDITGPEGAEQSRESSRNEEQFSKTRTIFPTHQHKESELNLIPGLPAACFKNLLPYNIIMPREWRLSKSCMISPPGSREGGRRGKCHYFMMGSEVVGDFLSASRGLK